MTLESGYLRNNTPDSRFWFQKVLFTLGDQLCSVLWEDYAEEPLVPDMEPASFYGSFSCPVAGFTSGQANSCPRSKSPRATSKTGGCWVPPRLPEAAGGVRCPPSLCLPFSHS